MPTSFSSNIPSDLSRRERERLMRRRAMLRAAQAVFAEKGYAGATLDEIAERAEFGKGTLYNYFDGGKEGLLFAVFDEIYDEFCALIRETCSAERVADSSLRSCVHDFVVRAFLFYEEREDLFMILIKEGYRLAFSDDTEKAAYFHDQQERMVDALAPAFAAEMESGAIRDLPVDAVAHMLLENLNGMVIHRCIAERRAENGAAGDGESASAESPVSEASGDDCAATSLLHTPEAAADFLIAMIFDGLQTPSAPESADVDGSRTG